MNIYDLVVPLGIAGYLLMAGAFVTGILRMKMKYHKALAIAGLIVVTIHAAIIIYSM